MERLSTEGLLQADSQANRVGGALRHPSSHTSVRTALYTVISVILGAAIPSACCPLSAQTYLTDSVRYFRLQALLRGICSGQVEKKLHNDEGRKCRYAPFVTLAFANSSGASLNASAGAE